MIKKEANSLFFIYKGTRFYIHFKNLSFTHFIN